MTNRWQADVQAFHASFGQTVGDYENPDVHIGEADRELRFALIDEEFGELRWAMENGNLAETADACADLIYVVLGTAVTCGIDLEFIWEEVQRSNMEKTTGPMLPNGKKGKPDGWTPPDITSALGLQRAWWHFLRSATEGPTNVRLFHGASEDHGLPGVPAD
jgi:NTP pyrophosphatase (non-canonical NTP hydrolase)